MTDLTTSYLGLKLKNPVIIGSSGLTNTIDKIRDLEKNRAGAVVLKSIFEEQILMEIGKAVSQDVSVYPEAADYISNYTKAEAIGTHLRLIGEAKKTMTIPVIASINCVSAGEWTGYAKKIESAGADALEINAFILPSNAENDSVANEKFYFDLIGKVHDEIKIPIALKMSSYSSGLAGLIQRIDWTGHVDGLVLFNRFYSPDIDIERMTVTTSNVFSEPGEITTPLRWIALMSGKVKCDLAATTGIHDGDGVIKQILAGAQAVQIVSCIYKNGPEYIGTILKSVEDWMERNKFSSLKEFRGKMSQNKVDNPAAFERIQFMKYYAGIE
ncbi:MAG: dihydroorotate dehydrogenase-like protein [Bacteroidetes bacterium]|nr:dihydroorotate dehydrogenase-like protein [Bacteroidota bacterium]